MKSTKHISKGALAAVLFITIAGVSCKKFLNVGAPETELASVLVYGDAVTAINAMVSIYGDMMSTNTFISDYSSQYLGFAADELQSIASPLSPYYTNSLTTTNDDFWSKGYKYIYQANAVAEGVAKSSLPDSTKNQLTGEAIFVRAFCHFYMVNLFGDIPYINTTDYRVNNLAVREPVAQVYGKILNDLLQARDLVRNYYMDGTNNAYLYSAPERVRPNKAVVTAMIARVYLYMGNWAQAEAEATTLINNPLYSLPAALTDVFLKNSKETIWQLMPSNPAYLNGYSGYTYVLNGSYGTRPVLANSLWNAVEPGDKRKTTWMGTYSSWLGTQHFAYKYRISTTNQPAQEYYMVFRLGEQYLIRAEARANQTNVAGAAADLNILRDRARVTPADLPPYPATLSKDDCLAAVAHERQVELFTEWGHRWLDLKRTGKADAVLGPLKGATSWQTTDQLFPIPQTQLDLNPNMHGQQNPGYTL
jgi:hypothetical protein